MATKIKDLIHNEKHYREIVVRPNQTKEELILKKFEFTRMNKQIYLVYNVEHSTRGRHKRSLGEGTKVSGFKFNKTIATTLVC